MPKKTKKEKMLSQNRKLNKKTDFVQTISTKKQEILPQTSQVNISISPALSYEENQINNYFIHDLKKSLLIIGCIFALEFFFYFATMSNYLAKYLNF